MIRTYHLYNNTVIVNFDVEQHKYIVNGVRAIGATTVTSVISKPALIDWSAREAVGYIKKVWLAGRSFDEISILNHLDNAKVAHRNKKDAAANIGQTVHDWIDAHIKGENPPDPINPNVARSVTNFLHLVKTHKIEFIKSEFVIYSKKYNYCGKVDFLCRKDGKLYIGDNKTSSGIYPEMFIQTAGYQQGYEEETGEKIDGNIILQIGKDGSFSAAEQNRDECLKNIEAFNGALVLYKRLKEIRV